MKCKACGSELITGTKKCPYCGALNNIVVKKNNDAFDWSQSDFHKQSKRKKNVSIDWNAGRIFDNESGQVYDQEERIWKEPEGVKELFNFDRKNEEYQAVLDRQVDSITESAADRMVARSVKIPSPMDSEMFASLLNDDNAGASKVAKKADKAGGNAGKIKAKGYGAHHTASADPSEKKQGADEAVEKASDKTERAAAQMVNAEMMETDDGNIVFSFDISDLAGIKSVQAEKAAAEAEIVPEMEVSEQEKEKAAEVADTYTKEEEYKLFTGLEKLMAAEEKFKSDMERVSYLTPEETAKAAKLEEKTSKLMFVPTVSFRSIEDEYAAYCDENGIKPVRPERTEGIEVKDAVKTSETVEGEAASKYENGETPVGVGSGSSHKITAASLKERLKRFDSNKDKEVEIKINELSGTKVTVKTQEVSLAAANAELDRAQTREVNMDEVMNPPKNLQVSVEVNAAQGNASVEVTRRHDGATVVKTVDKSSQEPLYGEESKELADTSAGADADETKKTGKKDHSFWERSDGVTRMTITDIFGPEARKIISQIDKAYNEDDAEEDIENSLILDINPEDIAMTEDQTAALRRVSFENEDDADEPEEAVEAVDEYTENAEADEENAASEMPEAEEKIETESSVAVVVSEEKVVESAAPEVAEQAADKETEKQQDKHEVAAEVENPDRISENNAEIPEISINNENVNENTDAKVTTAPADQITAEEKTVKPEGTVNISKDDSSTDDGPHLEKTKPLMKAEKAILKEAARQKKRAEKAQKQLIKENEVEENGAFSKFIKALIAILVIILIAEFSFIGIKLYMPDSQAGIFIERVEENVFGMIAKIRGGSDDVGDGGQESQNVQDQGNAQNNGTSGGSDGAAQDPTGSGEGE